MYNVGICYLGNSIYKMASRSHSVANSINSKGIKGKEGSDINLSIIAVTTGKNYGVKNIISQLKNQEAIYISDLDLQYIKIYVPEVYKFVKETQNQKVYVVDFDELKGEFIDMIIYDAKNTNLNTKYYYVKCYLDVKDLSSFNSLKSVHVVDSYESFKELKKIKSKYLCSQSEKGLLNQIIKHKEDHLDAAAKRINLKMQYMEKIKDDITKLKNIQKNTLREIESLQEEFICQN